MLRSLEAIISQKSPLALGETIRTTYNTKKFKLVDAITINPLQIPRCIGVAGLTVSRIMTKPKTKRQSSLAPGPADKKLRNGNGKEGQALASDTVIDQLCDNTLLRILSYADLPSLILFTRCTCKYLRSRFDPKTEASEEISDNQCSKIWPQVFKDLHMCL